MSASAVSAGTPNRWAVLAVLSFTRFTMGVQFQSVPPVAPYLVADLGLDYAQVGWLIGLFALPGVALSFVAGVVAARLGDKRVILLGLSAMVAGAELFATAGLAGTGAPAFAVAFLGRLLTGMGFVLVNVQMMKTVTDHFAGRELSTAMGVLMTSWPTGIGAALAGLGALADWVSWQAALHGAAALSAGALVGVTLLLPASRPAAEPARDDTGAAAPSLRLLRTEVGLIVVLSLLWGLYNAGFMVFLGFAPTLLEARGAEPAFAAARVSIVSWAWAVAMPVGGWLADRAGRPDLFIHAGAVAAAVPVVLLVAGMEHAVVMVAAGLALGLAPSAIMTLPAEVMRPAVRNVGFGLFYTMMTAYMALLPAVAGWLLDATGRAAAPVWLAASIFLGTTPALLGLRGLQRRWTPTEA